MDISAELNEIIVAAYREAESRGHEYLTPEHVLYASLFFDRGREIILACGGNVESTRQGSRGLLSHPHSGGGELEAHPVRGLPVRHGERHPPHRFLGKGIRRDRRHTCLHPGGEGILRGSFSHPAGHRPAGASLLHLARRHRSTRNRGRSSARRRTRTGRSGKRSQSRGKGRRQAARCRRTPWT